MTLEYIIHLVEKNPHPISAVAIGLLVSSLVAGVHRAAHHTTRVQLHASLDEFKCYSCCYYYLVSAKKLKTYSIFSTKNDKPPPPFHF